MSERDGPQRRQSPGLAIILLQTAQQNHVQLSAMADQKASILMGATFVIFTITIGQAQGSVAPVPMLILGAAAFASAVFAVLAVLPQIRYKGKGDRNLLFFGSFVALEEREYIDALTERLEYDDTVYETMARDIYQHGVVLAKKKYRLLGSAYRVFLGGMTASLIAFVGEYVARSTG